MSEPAGFEVGDRVKTPAGNFATILEPPWSMPIHTLIAIDAGETLWILSELLTPAEPANPAAEPAKRKRKAARTTAT